MDEPKRHGESEPPGDRGLGWPRFRLVTLLAVVTGFSVVLAVHARFGGFAAAIVTLFMLAVLAHVVGNWLGNQLRDLGNQPAVRNAPGAPLRPAGRVESHEFAEVTRLGKRQPIPRWVKFTVAVGTVLGGLSGGVLMILWNDGQMTWLSYLIGAVAFMVLGAIWTFALGAFVHVGWTAWRQAARFDEK